MARHITIADAECICANCVHPRIKSRKPTDTCEHYQKAKEVRG